MTGSRVAEFKGDIAAYEHDIQRVRGMLKLAKETNDTNQIQWCRSKLISLGRGKKLIECYLAREEATR